MQRYRTALLSYGLSGRVFHAPFLSVHPGFELIGAWERSQRRIAHEYPGSRSFASLSEVLDDPAIELVVVNTPTHTHFDYAMQALKAGKHVVVEKAFTNNAEEAVELKRIADEKARLISVYQNRRWDSDFLTVHQVLKENLVGEVVEAQISFDRYNPELSPKAHREMPGPGAGNLMDLGPHCVDKALVLFGMPEAVFADLRSCRTGSLVDDYFEVLLYYPGLRVRLHSSYLVAEPAPGIIIHGREGTFVKSLSNIQEVQLKQGMRPDDPSFGLEPPESSGILFKPGDEKRIRIESIRGNYLGFFNQLFKALERSAPVPVTADEGIQVMRVLDAALESSRRDQLIHLR